MMCIVQCGQPMVTRKCNVCDADIGGENHLLRQDNKEARR